MINSDLFGRNFLRIKSKYLNPLINTTIDESKIQYWLIKELLLTNKIQFVYSGKKNEFSIYIEKDDFYKSLIAEISCFQTKAAYQIKEYKTKHYSSNWKFVSFYYYSFFSTFEFILFLHQGFTFIDEKTKNYIESVLSTIALVPISLDVGNYFFAEIGFTTTGLLEVQFKKTTGGGTHEDTWKRFSELAQTELKSTADTNEDAIIKQLNKIFSTYKFSYPSIIRNFYNYNPLSIFNDIYPQINFIQPISEDFLKKFLQITISSSDTNEHKAYVCQYCIVIISSLKEKLYNEYISKHKNDFFYKNNKKLADFVIE